MVLAGAGPAAGSGRGSMIARLANAEVLVTGFRHPAVPILLDARLCGCLSVRRASGADPLHEDDLTLLRVMAADVAWRWHPSRAAAPRDARHQRQPRDRVRDRT